MANYYASQSIANYNDNAPADDGTQTEANRVKYATVKDELADPIKTLVEAIDTELANFEGRLFLNGSTSQSTNYSVQASDLGKVILASNGITVTLLGAATATNGFITAVLNTGATDVTITPASGEQVAGLTADQSIILHPAQWVILRSTGSVHHILGGAPATFTKTSAYTVVAADNGVIIEGTGTWTLTLTAAATLGSGHRFTLKNVGTGVITIDGNASETIDNGLTLAIAAGQVVEVRCDGSNFTTVGLGTRLTQIVASTSLPSANNVDITDIPTGFSALILVVNGASFDTATRGLVVTLSTDNGSTFDTTSYNRFSEVAGGTSASSTTDLAGTPTDTAAATHTYQFTITGYEANVFTQCQWVGKSSNNNTQTGHSIFVNTSQVDGIRVALNSTGNFDAGTYALYGVR